MTIWLSDTARYPKRKSPLHHSGPAMPMAQSRQRPWLDSRQLGRGDNSGRGSLVPVQMLVREGGLAGDTQATSNPDFFY